MAETESLSVEVDGRRLQVSNLDKVMYPADGDHQGRGPALLRDAWPPCCCRTLKDRPVTRIRWPHGTTGPSFFEKNLPSGAPAWLRSVTVRSSGSRAGDSSRDTITYPLVDDTATLTYLANLASLELHVPQWRVDADGRPLPPDRLVIDLDPGSPAGLHECARLALAGAGAPGGAGPDQRAGHQRAARACSCTRGCRATRTPRRSATPRGRSPRT